MNNYARLSDVRHLCNADGATADDAAMLRAIGQASAFARSATSRQFHTTFETAYFSGEGCRELWLGRDLISITSIKVADTADQPSIFENTLVSGTDYTLWPRNAAADGKPYRKVILNPSGQFGSFARGVDNVQIVGKFGHSEILEAAGVTVTVATTSGLVLTTSATAVGTVEPGDMLMVEDEIVGDVTDVSPTEITVRSRGANGSTAAAHTAQALYIRTYPGDLMRAVAQDSARHLWEASRGYDGSVFRDRWHAIKDALDNLPDPASVI